MKRSNCILRSMMFVPGHRGDLFESAAQTNADAIIFDLEDSVRPASNKQVAREQIFQKVSDGLFEKFQVFIIVLFSKCDAKEGSESVCNIINEPVSVEDRDYIVIVRFECGVWDLVRVIFYGLSLVCEDETWFVEGISAEHAAYGVGDKFFHGVGKKESF